MSDKNVRMDNVPEHGVTDAIDVLLEKNDGGHVGEIHVPVREKAGMPQLDPTTFPSQIFWLVVTFSLLYILISKSALPRIHEIIDKRRSRIERDVMRAEQLSRDALKAQHAYEEMHRRAKEKASTLITESISNVRHTQEVELAKTDATIVSMLNKAETAIKLRQDSLRAEMVSFSESLAVRIVEELTGKTPDRVLVGA